MKKEEYLTSLNKKEKISTWLTMCSKITKRKPFSLEISRAALLVLDMQNFFLQDSSHAYIPSAKWIIPSIVSLIDIILSNKGKVFLTKHITSDDSKDIMRKWWRDTISLSDENSKIIPQIDITNAHIITKNKYSAFCNTDLEKQLRKYNISQLIITGVMSHLCCETTARDAFMKDFEVFFVVDCTATYTQELHLGTLRSITHGFGICLSSSEILQYYQ